MIPYVKHPPIETLKYRQAIAKILNAPIDRAVLYNTNWFIMLALNHFAAHNEDFSLSHYKDLWWVVLDHNKIHSDKTIQDVLCAAILNG